jgi:phosphatidylserine/phosphatidylglycerophosphate/cardiolipin synthase-like enzyme
VGSGRPAPSSKAAAVVILAVVVVAGLLLRADEPRPATQASQSISVYFSPHGGCTDAIVKEIQKAKTIVQIQAYSFTSTRIARAVVDAKGRGVAVTAILDKSQSTKRYSSATFLRNAGVAVFIDSQHALAHNKIMLIDGTTIITGSFNFTRAAENNNAENMLVIKGQGELYAAYERNFQAHLWHSTPY